MADLLGDAAAETTGGSVARGSAWNFAMGAIPQVYLIAISVAAARFLGPELFGRQSFIAFVEISLIMVLTGGIPLALSRYTASMLGRRRPESVRALVGYAWRFAIPSAAVAGALLLGLGLAGASPPAAWMLAGAVAVAAILKRTPQAALNGFQRWRGVATIGLVTGAVSTAAVVGVLAAGGGITGMFAVEAAAEAVMLVWSIRLLRQALASLRDRSPDERPPIGEMLRYAGVASFGVVLTLIVWRRSEFFFLERYSSDTEIGFYSIAFAAAAALMIAPNAIVGTLLPAVATLHGAGALERIRAGYSRAMRLVLTLTFPLAAGAAALGPALIELVYGGSFERAGVIVLILIAPLPLIALAGLSTVVLEAMGHLRVPLVAGAVAAGLNVGLDFALIPRYDAVGAAIANAVAQLAAGLPALLYASRFVGAVDWRAGSLVRAAVVAAVGGAAAWACVVSIGGAPGVVVGAVAGGCVFVALAGVMRILSEEDAGWLEGTAGGLLGGLVGRMIRFWARSPAQAQAL